MNNETNLEKKCRGFLIAGIITLICGLSLFAFSADLVRKTNALSNEIMLLAEDNLTADTELEKKISELEEKVEKLENSSNNTSSSEKQLAPQSTTPTKYDTFSAGELVEVNTLLPDYFDGKVAIYTDEYITSNPENFDVYNSLLDIIKSKYFIYDLKDIRTLEVGDAVIIPISKFDSELSNFYKELMEYDFVSPNIILLSEYESTDIDATQNLESLIRTYAENCSKAGFWAKVLYTDGMEQTYYYYVE